MADWTDLIGLSLTAAEAKADSYKHALAVAFVGGQPVAERPATTRSRPCVMVSMDFPFRGGRITAVHGVEEPTRLPANPDCEAGLHSWIDETDKLPADTECDRCGEPYGDPA
ncbi:hypothetical protein [Erythrobacter aureus]|uniref:Uncharacterized protein n=1 Tax=Erythrobacter aureus TaxID=2182384 RepID=A0A345YIQ3_9SPHN|nr:hypothetical protein [Erythrobacter aureus]AXK43805.1 hypothetical protein DVR09_15225 [Erythrobacter aureus]